MAVKVVFIITNLATGGAEVMLHNLLSKLDRSRFQPAVVSLMGKDAVGPRIEALGVPVHALGMSPAAPNPWLLVRLTRLLRQLAPDLVDTWMYHADLLGGVAARLAGCRRVTWGLHHTNLSKEGNKRSTLWVVKACALLSGVVPAGILSCSVRAKEVHKEIGYPAEKIHVIPNGYDLERFVPDRTTRASVRNELGLAPATPLVGLVARFDPQKNHLGFVQAAAMVAEQLPEVHFVLAGSRVDSDNTALRAEIMKHGMQGHMHLLGRRDDVPRLMAALDILVSSSSFGEAFPIVLGEAMACCVPCVTTDVGDSAEIVGDTGRVVAPGDMAGLARELVAVLRLPEAERIALGERARARVAANYEIGHVTRLYEAYFERVLADERQGSA